MSAMRHDFARVSAEQRLELLAEQDRNGIADVAFPDHAERRVLSVFD